MENISTYSTLGILGFLGVLVCIALGMWRKGFLVLVPVCFFVFAVSATMRDRIIAENLDTLGCTYIGSGEKQQPHVSPKRFYKCPDGIIRSN
jgi:hypothetical protein